MHPGSEYWRLLPPFACFVLPSISYSARHHYHSVTKMGFNESVKRPAGPVMTFLKGCNGASSLFRVQLQHDLEQIRKKCQNNPENKRPLRSEPEAKFIQSSAESQSVCDSSSSEAKSFHSEPRVHCLTNTCARSHCTTSLICICLELQSQLPEALAQRPRATRFPTALLWKWPHAFKRRRSHYYVRPARPHGMLHQEDAHMMLHWQAAECSAASLQVFGQSSCTVRRTCMLISCASSFMTSCSTQLVAAISSEGGGKKNASCHLFLHFVLFISISPFAPPLGSDAWLVRTACGGDAGWRCRRYTGY